MDGNLDKKTVSEVLNTAQQLSSIENLEFFRKDLHSLLKKLLNFEKGNFFPTVGSGITEMPVDLSSGTSYGISLKNLRLFRQYYHTLDPFNAIVNKKHPSVVTFEQIIPVKKLMATEYYLDFLKPQSIHDQMNIFLTSGNQLIGIIAMFRSLDSPGFSAIDRNKAQMITPFIANALDRVTAKRKNYVLEQTVKANFTRLPGQGVIVLDKWLSPIYSSDSINNLVSSLNSKINPNRPLINNLPKDLREVCAEMLATSSVSKRTMCITRSVALSRDGTNSRTIVQVKKINQLNSDPYILICINPDNQSAVSANLLKKFGISTREMDVINLLFNGKKNSEIGIELFISEYTVENHLRSIYRKMNVGNRTALVSKIIKASALH